MAKLVILDFDGTFTDLNAESAPFRQRYFAEIAGQLGMPLDDVLAQAAQYEAIITAEPERYGWMTTTTSIHIATVDPYIRLAPITGFLFASHGRHLSNDELVDRAVSCWKDNYHLTVDSPLFKSEAGNVMHAIAQQLPSWVVTNSVVEHVQKKIATLATRTQSSAIANLTQRVEGWARKYDIDDSFDVVERDVVLDGLAARNVALRRPHYYTALERIRAQHNVEWSDVLVVGDVFELDLALPYALGCTIGLVESPHTPWYERNFMRTCDRGHLLPSLHDILPLVGC